MILSLRLVRKRLGHLVVIDGSSPSMLPKNSIIFVIFASEHSIIMGCSLNAKKNSSLDHPSLKHSSLLLSQVFFLVIAIALTLRRNVTLQGLNPNSSSCLTSQSGFTIRLEGLKDISLLKSRSGTLCARSMIIFGTMYLLTLRPSNHPKNLIASTRSLCDVRLCFRKSNVGTMWFARSFDLLNRFLEPVGLHHQSRGPQGHQPPDEPLGHPVRPHHDHIQHHVITDIATQQPPREPDRVDKILVRCQALFHEIERWDDVVCVLRQDRLVRGQDFRQISPFDPDRKQILNLWPEIRLEIGRGIAWVPDDQFH
ncbi:hypothetical protein CDL15_Pgr005639 [Punica granatum]|uniref:Uncharacterized protein n=1 Tax=Punica granatum TaxID=22663 RepID=A0A218WHH2_PUNGR|nr:hypothetical protein CDL15_Pgr005639 [Punica granatum]